VAARVEVSATEQRARRLSPWIRAAVYLLLATEVAVLNAQGVPLLPLFLIAIASGVLLEMIGWAETRRRER